MRMCCFKMNIWQTFCDTDLTFCVMIAKEQGFSLRAKKSQTLVCPNGQPSQLIVQNRLSIDNIKYLRVMVIMILQWDK